MLFFCTKCILFACGCKRYTKGYRRSMFHPLFCLPAKKNMQQLCLQTPEEQLIVGNLITLQRWPLPSTDRFVCDQLAVTKCYQDRQWGLAHIWKQSSLLHVYLVEPCYLVHIHLLEETLAPEGVFSQLKMIYKIIYMPAYSTWNGYSFLASF